MRVSPTRPNVGLNQLALHLRVIHNPNNPLITLITLITSLRIALIAPPPHAHDDSNYLTSVYIWSFIYYYTIIPTCSIVICVIYVICDMWSCVCLCDVHVICLIGVFALSRLGFGMYMWATSYSNMTHITQAGNYVM